MPLAVFSAIFRVSSQLISQNIFPDHGFVKIKKPEKAALY